MAQCISPITVRNKTFNGLVKGSAFVEVPCGVCIPCRKKKAAFLTRLCQYEQQEFYKKGLSCSFNCLTYSPARLPLNSKGLPTLRKDDWKKFMKRFRQRVSRAGYKSPFKFLACGEYGSQDNLPHYHFILFGMSDACADPFIRSAWAERDGTPFGRVDVKPLLAGGITYVCSYVMTSSNGVYAVEKYDGNGLERPFMCHSQKLGLDYLLSHEEELRSNNWLDSEFNSSSPFFVNKYIRDYWFSSSPVNPMPFIHREELEASKRSLSVSDFQFQQQQIAIKNAVLQSRNDGVPVFNENVSPAMCSRSNSVLTARLASEASEYEDKIPF